jgi:hypothetical protein
MLSSQICLRFWSCLFLSGFLTKILYAFLILLICATCTTYSILLDFITLIIFDELYKLWSPLCNLLQLPVVCNYYTFLFLP